MDESEKLVSKFLAHRGYSDVVYEPDGNVPPDFLVNGRIAIEVRRLNQNYVEGDKKQGLEQVAIPLRMGVERILSSLGPPTNEESWFVFFDFRRPLEARKSLNLKIKEALEEFKEGVNYQDRTWDLGNGFELEVRRCSNVHPTFFVMGGYIDHESGGWVTSEVARNLQICLEDKAKKIASVRSKYPEWWLILADHIAYSLDDFDRENFKEEFVIDHDWEKIILVDPLNHTRFFEIERLHGLKRGRK